MEERCQKLVRFAEKVHNMDTLSAMPINLAKGAGYLTCKKSMP
jgi:hypothetical protein